MGARTKKPNSYRTTLHGSNDSDNPVRALTIAVLHVTVEECEYLGRSRQAHLKTKGSEWSKYARNWGMIRRMVAWLHGDQFFLMTRKLGYDEEATRSALLKKLAGA